MPKFGPFSKSKYPRYFDVGVEIPAGNPNYPRILSRLRLKRFEQDIIWQIHNTS